VFVEDVTEEAKAEKPAVCLSFLNVDKVGKELNAKT
jgi:hypothetical protein